VDRGPFGRRKNRLTENTGIFVAVAEHSLNNIRWELVYTLRREGFYVDTDFLGRRSLRSQLKTANRKGFPYLIIIGPDEVKRGNITVRNMKSGSQEEVSMHKLSIYLSSLMEEGLEEGC
jgi:histidyl-tRNA synthetase